MRARVRTSPTDRWHRWLGRETSSTLFIPEIDGLRFIAIASVILYHLSGFYLVKTGRIPVTRLGPKTIVGSKTKISAVLKSS